MASSQPPLDRTSFEFEPSFVHHNGKVSTIVQLYVRPGSNSSMSFQDILDFMPVDTLRDVSITLLEKDLVVKDDEKKKLIHDNASSNKATITQGRNYDRKHAKSTKDLEDKSTEVIHDSEILDYDAYEMILDSADPVVVFKIQLLITGPSEEIVEEQLQQLNALLDQRHEGARWDSLPGDQRTRLCKLFAPIEKDASGMTSTASNYAGLNFSASPGLSDQFGWPLGIDSLSLTGSTALIDFERSLRGVSVIAVPGNDTMPLYHGEQFADRQPLSTASLIGQLAANQVSAYGHHTAHIVLNSFDYFESNRFFRPSLKGVFDRFDMSKQTINPLQGFGSIKDVVGVYDRLIHKIVNVFKLLLNLEMTQADRAVVLAAVERFYFNQQLWFADAAKYPKRTRIVNITDPVTYPRMDQLIHEFTTLAQQAARDNRELKADRIDTLAVTLNQALSAHIMELGRPTSITDPKGIQSVYELQHITSDQMRQIQLVNSIGYVASTLREGDLLVLHGLDRCWKSTMLMLSPTIKALCERNVRVLLCYDAIASTQGEVDASSSFLELKGTLYNDLDTDVALAIIGKLTPDELAVFEKVLNKQLSEVVRSSLLAKSLCQVLVHRAASLTDNFVRASVIV